jgi:hypothetical protein
MTLLKRLFFTKTPSNELVMQTVQPSEHLHILKIEVHEKNTKVRIHESIPNMEYHIYDNKSARDLPGIHVVLTVYYSNTQNVGGRFRLDTKPTELKNNFSSVLKWNPEDTVKAIRSTEMSIQKDIGGQFVFSKLENWEIQYYGLIRELHRKNGS